MGEAKDAVSGLYYWKIAGRSSATHDVGKSRTMPVDETTLSTDALTGLTSLLKQYNDDHTAFLSYPLGTIKAALSSNDYKHLSRVNEWSVSDDNADGDTSQGEVA